MNNIEKEFLSDTIAILIGYDGEHEVEGLKALIDETRERLTKLYKREVKKEDLGMKTNLDNHLEVIRGGKDDKLVVEYKGKRYSVIGEGDGYYIATEPFEEADGKKIYIPKNDSKIVE
jgi:flavodoxin